MPIYRAEFLSAQETNVGFQIDFHVGNTINIIRITLGGNPCTISQVSNGLFSPIKSRSCTIDVVTQDYLGYALYTPVARGIKVIVRRIQLDAVAISDMYKVIFRGYVTPNVYDQTYKYLDNVSVECIDAISTLKEYRYSTIDDIPKYRKMIDYIVEFCKDCGYEGKLRIPLIYNKLNGTTNIKSIEDIYVSEGNFFDDDSEHSSWTKYNILEEILQYLGLSLTIDGEDIWLVDYRLNYGNDAGTSHDYYVYNMYTDEVSYEYNQSFTYTIENYAGGTSNLSLDEVYNKIEVNDNLYEIDDVAPDIYDENIHISINSEQNMGAAGSKWVTNTVRRHFLSPKTTEQEVTGYQYQTFCRFDPDKTNWTHYYYKHGTLTPCDSYYDTDAPHSMFQENLINRYINTNCCLIQHYAYRSNEGSNNLPTSLDWEDYLTFFVTDDRDGSFRLADIDKFEKKVLEYEVKEEVCWRPSSGISWICIKGDLYYQYNGAKYGEKDRNTLTIVTDRMYQTAPVEKCVDINDEKYCSLIRTYQGQPQFYNTGFKLWKMGVHIGGKSWNGNSWVDDAYETVTFYINYNNNPSNREDEYMAAFKWMSPVPNVDYTAKVGDNCYAIPIKSTDIDDVNSPSFGKLKVEIFAPRLLGKDLTNDFTYLFGNSVVDWSNIANVIYCKDFDIDYRYTDTQIWYSQRKDDKDKKDLVYTNIINVDYTNEFDSIEMKINTQQKDKPISRSYACTENGYVDTLRHICDSDAEHPADGVEQEENIIDLYYYHHCTPKKKYSCNAHVEVKPMARYKFKQTDPINDDIDYPTVGLVLDSYSLDLLQNNARLELVEY